MIGKKIRDLRYENNLTQQELSKILGVSKSSISLYENGKMNPEDNIKIKIVDYFNLTLDDLFGRKICINLNNNLEEGLLEALKDWETLNDESKKSIINFINFVKDKNR